MLFDYWIAIVEDMTKSDDTYVQGLVTSGIIPQLIRLLEFEEVASRALSVVFLLVNDNIARKREVILILI